MTRAKNFWLESMTCLWSNPFTCKKRSVSSLGTLPFDSNLEMHLQNGSILYICSSACNQSVVSGFGVVLGVSVTSGVTASDCGFVVGSSVVVHWVVLLLVLNAGPSVLVADSIWTVAGCLVAILTVMRGNQLFCFRLLISTQRQCCKWLVLIPICWLYYWHSYHWEILPVVCGHCILWLQLLGGSSSIFDCIIHNISFLFHGAPFLLCVSVCMWKKSYWKFHSIMFLW